VTAVETLEPDARLEEIARMLAGTQVTDAARKAAASLLADREITDRLPKRKLK